MRLRAWYETMRIDKSFNDRLSPGNYSLAQIGEFLLAESPAVHGVSPAAYAQNEILYRLASVGCQRNAPEILGCQIIGSRAQGSSELYSDLDIAFTAYREDVAVVDNLGTAMRSALLPAGIEVDWRVAPSVAGVRSLLPTDPHHFVQRIAEDPRRAIALCEVGVFDAPDMRLGALAASEVLRCQSDPQKAWQAVRKQHAWTYLGDPKRVRAKLAERLGVTRQRVGRVITNALWDERVRRFGLPAQFDEHYERQMEWLTFKGRQASFRDQSIALYEGVRGLLRAP